MQLSPGVLDEAYSAAVPVVYYVSDEWPIVWQSVRDASSERLRTSLSFPPARWIHRGLAILLGTNLRIRQIAIRGQCASEYLRTSIRTAGVQVGELRVVKWGIKRDAYICQRNWNRPVRRFLFAGQLSEHKGVHTAIQAFGKLCKAQPDMDLKLSLAGAARDREYEGMLHSTVKDYDLSEKVEWLGMVSEEALRGVYKTHDAFIFTSIWNEPFSIALVEAMSSGMVVVGTTTGGTGELIKSGGNALTFEAGDVEACKRQLERVVFDTALCKRLSASAIDATIDLTIESMAEAIEQHLSEIVDAAAVGNRSSPS